MSLIDRDETYKVLSDYYHHRTEIQHDALKEALDRVPEAEPKKGEWKLHKSRALWICTNCKDTSLVTSRFCPNCGADMRGEQDG